MSDPMGFRRQDKVVVTATGETAVVTDVHAQVSPPIWCDNGSGYFPEELKRREGERTLLYNDKMSAEEQIDMEEDIAAMIFGHCDVDVDEETAGNLGRQILVEVLREFRPDLFLTDDGENPYA